jgi:hypothetical protein
LSRRRAPLIALSAMALTCLWPATPASAAQALTVDLATNTGAPKYGATGFLYGLGNDGIPTDTMLAGLKPQVTAQKAPDGLQHPNGDALQIAGQFKRTGGRASRSTCKMSTSSGPTRTRASTTTSPRSTRWCAR